MSNNIVYMDISKFHDLISGTNYAAYQAVIDEISNGITYIVENNGLRHKIILDNSGQLVLEHIG